MSVTVSVSVTVAVTESRCWSYLKIKMCATHSLYWVTRSPIYHSHHSNEIAFSQWISYWQEWFLELFMRVVSIQCYLFFKTPRTHNTMFKKTSKIFEKWNMTYCNILIYCLLSSFLHAFWTFQFVQLSFDLGDIIFWMMRENEKKDESKKFLLQEKSSLSSPLPPICLPPRSYTSSPESPTPWWNRR